MEQKLVLAYSHRWEPQWLIDGLLENTSWVDGVVEYDDSGRDPDDMAWNETLRYRELHRKAGEIGASHVLMMAPDERLADDSEELIRAAMDIYPDNFYKIKIFELFTPTSYRVDGIWGQMKQTRIYRWWERQEFVDQPLHVPGVPYMPLEGWDILIPVHLYHLKPIHRANQKRRVEVFNRVDPGQQYNQGLAYEWMTDEEELLLEEIPENKMYRPVLDREYIWDPTY